MNFEVITGLQNIRHFLPEWEKLWEQQEWRFPSTHPYWLLSWYEQFISEVEPFLCIGFRDSLVSSIAPMIRLYRSREPYTEGAILFAAYHTVDYADILALDESDLENTLHYLTDRFANQVLFFQNVRSDSSIARRINQLGLKAQVISEIPAPYLSLHESGPKVLDKIMSGKRRAEVRRRKRMAEQEGVTFRLLSALEKEELYWFIGQSAYLQIAGLASNGIPSNFSDPRVTAFYGLLLDRMSSKGLLRISYAELNSRLLAFAVGFNSNRVLYQWLTAYDRQYSHLGLGVSILFDAIRDSILDDMREVDLMKGDEEYKRIWTLAERTVTTYRILP